MLLRLPSQLPDHPLALPVGLVEHSHTLLDTGAEHGATHADPESLVAAAVKQGHPIARDRQFGRRFAPNNSVVQTSLLAKGRVDRETNALVKLG